MNEFIIELHNLADTDRLGDALAETLPPNLTVALNGTLGAGKTRLVEALAAALGVARDDVVSPTFVLCQQYSGETRGEARTLLHFDAYRLADEDEFLELGVEEYFESEAIVLIEWADRVRGCLPRDHLTIELKVTGDSERMAKFIATGKRSSAVIEQLRARYAASEETSGI